MRTDIQIISDVGLTYSEAASVHNIYFKNSNNMYNHHLHNIISLMKDKLGHEKFKLFLDHLRRTENKVPFFITNSQT